MPGLLEFGNNKMTIPIEYIGFLGGSGYGFAARNYILSLHLSGKFDVKVVSLDGPISKGITLEHYNLFQSLLAKKENPNAPPPGMYL